MIYLIICYYFDLMAVYTFKLFSVEHIVSIVSVIAFYIIFFGYHEKFGIKGGSKIFPVVLSAILVSLDISEDIILSLIHI